MNGAWRVERAARAAVLAAVVLVGTLTTPSAGAQGPLAARTAAPNPASEVSWVPHRVAHNGRFTDFEAMVSELSRADVVFVGEQHDDVSTHRLQLALLEGLKRRRGAFTLSLEMFERDVQGPLDAWLAGAMPESTFLAAARPWPNYDADYRPLTTFARANSSRVIAANVPRSLASAVSRGGLGIVDTLAPEKRALIAQDLVCGRDRDKYRDKFFRTMADMSGHGGPAMSDDVVQRFFEAQCIKDETMAESIVAELTARPGTLVVHMNGAFHSDEKLGTASRVARRMPNARVAVVSVVPVPRVDTVQPKDQRRLGDFVVYVWRPEPPPPLAAIDADTERLMARLGALAHDSMEGRGAGTAGGVRGRAYLESELRRIGVPAAFGEYQVPVRVRARPGADTLGANIVARIPGRTAGGPVLVLTAHHDHLGVRNDSIYNGADDNASGSVAVVTLAERLLRNPPQHDVWLAIFEAEESGMLGSRAFVEDPRVPMERVAVNVNLDMIARQDAGALWVAGTSHYPFLRAIVEPLTGAAAMPVRFGHDTRGAKPSDDWTMASDHASFHRRAVPFLYLGVEDHADYHGPGDTADKVDPRFYRATTDFAEAVVRALDARLPAIHSARTAANGAAR